MALSDRQQQIVNESVKLIANKGIQSLTIKNISKKIGISEPAIYRHFASKMEILMVILNSFKEMSAFVLSETEKENTTAPEKIERFLFDRYNRFSAKPELAKVMFSEEAFQNDPMLSRKILEIMHKHRETMEEIIISGQQSGELRDDIDSKEMFRIIIGSMRLLVTQWCLTNFIFDLKGEGQRLWLAVQKMIEKN